MSANRYIVEEKHETLNAVQTNKRTGVSIHAHTLNKLPSGAVFSFRTYSTKSKSHYQLL